MTSTYQAWLNKDREWSGGYCSRTRKSSLTKVVPLTLLLTALVLGGVGLLSGGGVPGLVSGALGGLMSMANSRFLRPVSKIGRASCRERV